MARNKVLRAAVIGVGAMGRNHARPCAESPYVRLVGVADQDPEACAQIAERYQIGCHVDYSDMVEADKPEMAVVSVPTIGPIERGSFLRPTAI